MRRLALLILILATPAAAQWQVPLNGIPVGRGPGVTGFNSVGGSAGAGAKCLLDTAPPTFGTCPGSGNRTKLLANTTFYVRSDGNDTTCNGTANASAASAPNCAKLTWNNLYSTVAAAYDFAGFTVTLTSGTVNTYTGLAINNAWVGGGQLTVDLGGATIAETTTKAFINNARQSGGIILQNGTISTTSGSCVQNSAQTSLFVTNMTFGNCATADFEATQGGLIFLTGATNTFAAGSAGYHFLSTYAGSGIYPVGATDTFTGNRTYSAFFAYATQDATIKADSWSCSGATGCAVVGAGFTISGTRYSASLAGTIYTNGGGANFFPGNAAGFLGNGGCYDNICGFVTANFFGSSSGSTNLQASATASGTLTLPAATDTLIAKATTDTLTNKSIDTGSNTFTFGASGSTTTTAACTGGGTVSAGSTITWTFKAYGKMVWANATATPTHTCTTSVSMPLPTGVGKTGINQSLRGQQGNVGLSLRGWVASGTSAAECTTSAGNPCTSATQINLSGWYEIN